MAGDAAQDHANRAKILRAAAHWDEAAACYARALALEPTHAEALNGLAIVLRATGRLDEAIATYQRAIDHHPRLAGLHNNLGNALKDAGRREEAIAAYRRALTTDPDMAEAHCHLAIMLRDLGDVDEAMARYRRAIAIRPDYAEAWNNLGNLLAELGRSPEAIACYQRALAIRPGYAAARVQKLDIQARLCDWRAIAAEAAMIPALGIEGEIVPPFAVGSFEDAPERHRWRAERYAGLFPRDTRRVAFPRPAERPRRLRIGYFSADFHDHATLRLMIRLFELHDRERFDIRAYSYGPPGEDAMRLRFLAAVERFTDVRSLGDVAAANVARRDDLDIAVDLKGYTQYGRPGILASRVAPIQMSYLGYPGTLGTRCIDYMIADHIVVPPEQRAHYSESIIYLPDSYQPTDDRRVTADPPDRAALGLPADAFIFCAFHNSYKIGPAEFDIWMRLLHAVEGSLLWLLRTSDEAEGNLRAEAIARGIAPERLVFAPLLPQAEHLARQHHADLFLDCFVYNAHTTASDALWMGVPVVTRSGRGFPARVAASLLHAIGLPELIADSCADYESLALRLATDRAAIDAVKAKLAAHRASYPLFRPERITRAIERGYDAAYGRYLAGEPPADLAID